MPTLSEIAPDKPAREAPAGMPIARNGHASAYVAYAGTLHYVIGQMFWDGVSEEQVRAAIEWALDDVRRDYDLEMAYNESTSPLK